MTEPELNLSFIILRASKNHRLFIQLLPGGHTRATSMSLGPDSPAHTLPTPVVPVSFMYSLILLFYTALGLPRVIPSMSLIYTTLIQLPFPNRVQIIVMCSYIDCFYHIQFHTTLPLIAIAVPPGDFTCTLKVIHFHCS